MRALSLIALGALPLAGCMTLPGASSPDSPLAGFAPCRVIPIPLQGFTYSHFRSQAIGTRDQLEAFRAAAIDKDKFNQSDGFLNALDQANIDFEREALVLIRQADGSSSETVTLRPPWRLGDTLHCTVHVHRPNGMVRDVQSRCFALVVPKDRVRRVEVRVRSWWETEAQETIRVPE